jgi:uncharacterized membrane protein (UPF0127 family)
VHLVQIIDKRSGAALAERAGWCSSPWTRFRGLMLRSTLPSGEGIVLLPCGSVHMALMRFAIDVIYLDREQKVVKLVSNLKPYRISFGGRRAHSALELPTGTIKTFSVAIGDEIAFKAVEAAGVAAGSTDAGNEEGVHSYSADGAGRP